MESIPDSVQLKIYDTLMDVRANHRKCSCIIQFLENKYKQAKNDPYNEPHGLNLDEYKDRDYCPAYVE